ncbi:MAG: VanZ family protein [Duncaniella sp.]|nr:VanZ family protein [Duncaniella sp.]
MIASVIRRFYSVVPPGVPGALVVAIILYLTLAPQPLGDDTPELFEGADKVVHAIMFGAMAFTLSLDRLMGRGSVSRKAMIVITVLAIATGIVIECLQGAMDAGRSADVADGIADTIGALAGAWIFTRVRKILGKRRQ